MTINKQKSFILYKDQIEVVRALTDEQAGQLLKAFYEYQEGKITKLDAVMSLVFLPFKASFERDSIKWKSERIKRVEAGRQGGLKRAENERNQASATHKVDPISSKSKQTQANQAVSVSVSVSDSVSNKENKLTQKLQDKPSVSSSYKENVFDVKPYLSYYYTKFGVKITNISATVPALRRLLKSGYTQEDIFWGLDQLSKDTFWKEKGFDFLTVVKQLPKLKQAESMKQKGGSLYDIPRG